MAMNVFNWLRPGKALLLTLLASLLWFGVQAAEQQPIAIRPDAPSSYTVVQGDTLWDIAGRFLEQPWLWPQVWQINPQIQNPDLIYPGDVIGLSYQDGRPVLTLNRDGETGTPAAVVSTNAPVTAGVRNERRSPEVRREALLSPIPAIPLDKINAFLTKSSVVAADNFENAPYLLAEREGRTLFSEGDEVFARGNFNPAIVTYNVVREGRRFTDPDTDELLGVESILIGTASITSYNGDRAIMSLETSEQEARVGDRLLPREQLAIDSSYMPRPPAFAVDAAIANIGSGHDVGGQYDTLVLNQGSNIGLQAGHLLVVHKPGLVVEDNVGRRGFVGGMKRILGLETSSRKVEFPGENAGNVLIYRVYEHASLGLVLDANQDISIRDRAITP